MLTLIRRGPLPLQLALLATLAHIAVTVALLGQPERPDALFNGLYDTVILTSTLTCLLAWRQAPAHLRRGLGLLTAAMLSRLTADLLWSFLQLGSGEIPFPSVADLFYLLEYPLFGVAFLRLTSVPIRPLKAARLFLDSLILVGALTTFLWWGVLHAFVGEPGDPIIGTLVNFAYPVFDLGLLVVLLMVVLHGRRLERHLTLFALGFGFTVVADLVFVLLASQEQYYMGHPVDPLFTVGIVLWALGAWEARRSEAAPRSVGDLGVPRLPERVRGVLVALPYAGIVAACLFLLLMPHEDTLRGQGMLIGVVLTMLVTVARQAVAFADNRHLTLDLRRANTELRRSREQLSRQAWQDPLTGLANRARFEAELSAALHGLPEDAADTDAGFAVVFIDLDDFKAVNDTHGHAAGDELLVEVAARLRGAVRPGDVVARQGGDEFLALLRPASAVEARAVAGQLLAALIRPYPVAGRPGQTVTVGASVGVSLSPHDAREAGELRRCADLAMYRAKQEGKNTLRLFSDPDPDAAPSPGEVRLRGALSRGDFRLVYQPQCDAAGGQVLATEALLRWRDDELGEVSPGCFIPVAEASGLIVPVGAWVLDEACRQLAEWRLRGWTGRMAVNVSPVQLTQPDFQDGVLDTLRRHGLRGEDLELEITEGAVLGDARAASGHLARLREVGVRIAVDDFGMGHAALLYLLAFPVHVLKIDRTFVQGATLREHDRALVQALVTFAHALKLGVVAEGVETATQRSLMQELGVGVVQGYLLGRPQSAGELTPRLLAAPLPAVADKNRLETDSGGRGGSGLL